MLSEPVLNDALLHDLASQLGMDWFNLGLRLSLQPGLLEELRDGITVPVTEKPLRTLERWRAIRPPKTREIPTLCQALTKCSRNDLVQMVRQENREDGEMSRVFMKTLSDHLIRDWFTLGVYLGVPSSELQIIEDSTVARNPKAPGFTLLQKWRDSRTLGEKGATNELLDALKAIRRNDLVRFLETRVADVELEDAAMESYHTKGKGTQAEFSSRKTTEMPSQEELLTLAQMKKAASSRSEARKKYQGESESASEYSSYGYVDPPSDKYKPSLSSYQSSTESFTVLDKPSYQSSAESFEVIGSTSSSRIGGSSQVVTSETSGGRNQPYMPPNIQPSSSTGISGPETGPLSSPSDYVLVTSESSLERSEPFSGPSFQGHRSK